MAWGISSVAALYKPAKTVHRYHFNALSPCSGPLGQPALESLLGAALNLAWQPGRASAILD